MRHRWIFRTAVSLFIGLILTVLIGATSIFIRSIHIKSEIIDTYAEIADTFGTDLTGVIENWDWMDASSSGTILWRESRLAAQLGEERIYLERVDTGFPFYCFKGERIYRSDKSVSEKGLYTTSFIYMDKILEIPFIPRPLLLIANVSIYSILLFLAWTGLVAFKQHARIKKGQCPACKYPIGQSSVCSECGLPRPNRIKATG